MTYTREQILAMDAEQLAEATAIHVMGWKDGFQLQIDSDMGICERLRHNEFLGAAIWEKWNPAEDIAAAWEVVEKMRANKVYLDVRIWPDEYQVLPHKDENNKLVDGWIVKRRSLPEAICKAALLAVLDL